MSAPGPLVSTPSALPPGEAAGTRAAAARPRQLRGGPRDLDPAAAADDAKWRFLTCAALTVPLLYLSAPVQRLLGLDVTSRLPWAAALLLGLTAAVALYGGWPFATGARREMWRARPGRMTLAAVAIAGAFAWAVASSSGGRVPYALETAALVDVALLGLWAEMRSRTGTGWMPGPPGRIDAGAGRAAVGLTLAALAGGALALAGWALLSERGTTFAVERALAAVAIAAPQALGMALSLAPAASTRRGDGRHGRARFFVTDVLTPPDTNPDDVLALAARVACGRDHPLAAGIVRSARTRGLPAPPASDVEALPGGGARGRIGNREVRVLSPSAVREGGLRAPFEAVAPLEAEGRTVVWIVEDGRLAGAIALACHLRASHAEAGRVLQLRGVAGYHAVGLPLAAGALAGAGVVLPPAAGAALASLVAVGVTLSARRLRLDPD